MVTGQWNRFEISLKNEISLQPLNIFFTTQIALRPHSDIAIAFPQCEEGLFATSPIPPDVGLPAISDDPYAVGSTRAAEILYLDKEKTGVVIDSNSATAIIVAQPTPSTCQIMDDEFLPFLSFWSSESNIEISIGISGSHGARFVVRVKEGDKDEFTESSVIGGNELYFVCAVFDRNALSIIINGAIAITLVFVKSIIFERTYICCSHGKISGNFCGCIKKYILYPTPLLYPRILELYRELCPKNPQHTYDYMLRYFRYALTTESEISTFDACLKDEGFSYFIGQLDFAVPEIFNQFPPKKAFKEEDVRDWVMAIMKQPGAHAAREDYSKIGRTDLSLRYYFPAVEDPSTLVERTYRIEFKIWSRANYKKAPSQPLKYMSEDETACAFVMIDRRRTPSIKDFEKIIRGNVEFPCLAIKEVPILKSDLKYFISFHSDPRYRAARMIINIFIPIAN